jgi:hypothetical protein
MDERELKCPIQLMGSPTRVGIRRRRDHSETVADPIGQQPGKNSFQESAALIGFKPYFYLNSLFS